MFSTQPSDSSPAYIGASRDDAGDITSTDDEFGNGADISTDVDETGDTFELDVYGTNEHSGTGELPVMNVSDFM